MKRIDTTQETATSWSPFKVESKAFMQDANKEMVQALCKNIISNHGLTYSATVPYLMSSFTASFASDGTIFFNGELYVMRQNSGSIFAVIDATPDPTADPTTFSDATIHNIHNNRYLTFTNTATGSLFAMATIIDVTTDIAWKTYTATMTGATGTFNYANYLLKGNKLSIVIDCAAVATTGGASIVLNLPIAIPTGKRAVGTGIVDYFDGTTHFLAGAMVGLTSGGAGDAFSIHKSDYSAFPTATLGTFRLSIEIGFL